VGHDRRENRVGRRTAILAALAPAAGGSTLRIKLTGLAAAWLAVGALGAQSAFALVPGSFAPTGSMTVPRVGPAAAPLADGRVLVAGGVDMSHIGEFPGALIFLQSAEIFDPATETFSPTGSMTVPRLAPAAAPLSDGRVLVAGGSDVIHDALRSAEIFDPATRSFSPTGDLTVPRSNPVAAPLPDGRVLVAAGIGSTGAALRSAEIFDPATGTFSPTGDLTVPRHNAAAAAPLPDGRVLVAGGVVLLQSAEIFDPATGTFAPTGSMTSGRSNPAAAPLPDGRALFAGGGADHGLGAEIFDPTTATFAPTGSMDWPGRQKAAAAPLSDGRVLVAGGDNYFLTASAELFTPELSYWLRGRTLTASVAVAGTLIAADATGRRDGSAAAARKRRRLLKPTSAQGGPRPITLKLRLTAKGKRRLERKGKLKVRAKLRFAPAPVRGECVTVFSPCYSSSYAIIETATLRLKAKKRR
jgi:Kelch motif